jgi:hypothetical protein
MLFANAVVPQSGSRHRQTLVSQSRTVTRSRLAGAVEDTARRAVPDREHLAAGTAMLEPIRPTASPSWAELQVDPPVHSASSQGSSKAIHGANRDAWVTHSS